MKTHNLTPDCNRMVHMLRALGNPARYCILAFLARCPQCIVADIVDQTPLAQSTVSQHLKVLRQAGFIRGEIEGPAMNYCLDRRALRWLGEALIRFADGLDPEACCAGPAATDADSSRCS
jgi:ArsR family transcriptional regulator, arsenate/arsenite/antimonite-responsive transcriptional repressor